MFIRTHSEYGDPNCLYQHRIPQEYARNAHAFQERGRDDIHIRDVFNLYSRVVDGSQGKGNKIYARDVKLGRRSGGPPDRSTSPRVGPSGSPRERSRPTSPRAASLPLSPGPSRSHPHHSNAGSSEEDSSEGSTLYSTASAANVGMGHCKTSKEKPVRIPGVDGCHALFLAGRDQTQIPFITGAHFDSFNIVSGIRVAAERAKAEGTVTQIVLYAPKVIKYVPHRVEYRTSDTRQAMTELTAHFPNIRPTEKYYDYDAVESAGDWIFVATHGPPFHTEKHFNPKTPTSSPLHPS